MGALTPQFLLDLESRMQIITENEYGRLLQNLWWQNVAVRRTTEKAKEVLAWLLSTAEIRDEGPKGGNIAFEDLVTTQTTLEHRFSGAGLKLLKQQFEDTDGSGINLAAEWSNQIGAQMAYWPQLRVAEFLKNGHLFSYATSYDGKPFFATDHPVNPYKPEGLKYANLLTGAASGAYPGALPLHAADDPTTPTNGGVTVEGAQANLQKLYAYIASIRMPNGTQPRYLRPKWIITPPAMMFQLVMATQAKVIAQSTAGGGAAGVDVEAAIRSLGYAMPIQADELAGFENDTTYFVIAEQVSSSQLGGLVYLEREPFRINYYGPQTDAILNRAD